MFFLLKVTKIEYLIIYFINRETRSEYSLIIEVKDLGTPVQQATRTLTIKVKDIDDHAPMFDRQKNSVPLRLEVVEEMALGSKIGAVTAVDKDIDRNNILLKCL